MNTRISSLGQGNRSPILRGVSIDPKQFRSVMATFATGVAVIATEWSGELFGATINSLTSVSLEPCMLLFAQARAARRDGYPQPGLLLGEHSRPTSIRTVGPLHGKSGRTDLRILPSRSALTGCRCCKAPRLNSVAGSPRSTRRRPRYHPGRGALGRRDCLSSACFSQRARMGVFSVSRGSRQNESDSNRSH